MSFHRFPTSRGRAPSAPADFRLDALEPRQLLSAQIHITDSVAPADDRALALPATTLGQTSAALTFSVANTGDAPLDVANFTVAGDDAADFAVTVRDADDNALAGNSFTVGAGETYTLRVTFAPAATGARTAGIAFDTNDPGEGAISLSLTGLGVAPEIVVTDATLPDDDLSITFPGTTVGQPAAPQTFTIANTGDAPLEVTNFLLSNAGQSGGHYEDFTLTLLDDNGDPVAGDAFTVGVGETFTASVTFTPGGAGFRAATITFDTNDTTDDEGSIGLSISGMGAAVVVNAPAAPPAFAATAASDTQIDLAWAAPAGATGYRLYRSTAPGGPFTLIATPDAADTTYTDTALDAYTRYYYRVTATNAGGESATAATADARTDAPAELVPNNTLATATPLGRLGRTRAVTDFVGDHDARDFYRFSLGTRATLTARLSNLGGAMELRLYRVGPAGALTSLASSRTGAPKVTLALATGDYALRAMRCQGASTAYALDVVPDFAGNTRNTARDIGPLAAQRSFNDHVGTLDARDYYRFTLNHQRTLSLTLTGLSQDADLELYDATGTRLAESARDAANDELITQPLSAGTYFIRIFAFEPTAQTNYKLTASAT